MDSTITVDYWLYVDPDIDPDPYESGFICPLCKRYTTFKTPKSIRYGRTGEIQNAHDLIPIVEKGTKIILQCQGCLRLFQIIRIDLDEMELNEVIL